MLSFFVFCHFWFGNSWVKTSGVWITSSLYIFLVTILLFHKQHPILSPKSLQIQNYCRQIDFLLDKRQRDLCWKCCCCIFDLRCQHPSPALVDNNGSSQDFHHPCMEIIQERSHQSWSCLHHIREFCIYIHYLVLNLQKELELLKSF